MSAATAIKSPVNAATEQTLKPGSQAFNAIFGQNTAAVSGGKPSIALQSDSVELDEAGMDEEVVLGEVDELIADGSTEAATSGLFGGAAATAAVGTGGLAAGGAAALGFAAAPDRDSPQDGVPVELPGPVQVVEANSAGVNLGPSEDGSLLASAGKTEVGLLGSAKPLAVLTGLSVGNPDAPLPSGNPITVDPETQVLGINLGPLLQTELDLNLNDLPATLLDFTGDLGSLDLSLSQLLALDIPTSIGGTDLPVTDTLNEVLTQLDAALAPVTEALTSATASAPTLDGIIDMLGGAPLLGDVLTQVNGIVDGGLPTGELNLPITPEIPMTNTPLDLVTVQISQAIGSLNTGTVPLADTLNTILPV